jgi:glutathione S-transferase
LSELTAAAQRSGGEGGLMQMTTSPVEVTPSEGKTPDAPPRSKPASAIKAKLYGLRGAPPSFSAELMLRHKGIRYRRVNIIPGRHRKTLPAKGFPAGTAPAAVLDGQRVQTNRAIARALDELVPDPPLFPADSEARSKVEEAERFGDEVLQHATRRMTLWSLTLDPESVTPHPALGRLLVPRNGWLRARLMPRVFEYYGITDTVVRDHFEALPGWLDKLDRWIWDGVLNGPQLTAADFEIAPLIAALLGHERQRTKIAERPVAALVRRVMPA